MQALRETALIESTVSGCRLEGVEIGPERLQAIVAEAGRLHDRAEQEIHGYYRALNLIHGEGAALPISGETIRLLHGLVFPGSADPGAYRHAQSIPADLLPDSGSEDITRKVEELIRCWDDVVSQQTVHPFIAMAGFELDFLCVRPFEFGNDRVASLLSLLLSYHVGFEVGRYVSFERLIEQNRVRREEVLRISSFQWEQGAHDPWAYIYFVLSTLAEAYKEFQSSANGVQARKGAKTEMVLNAIQSQTDEFKLVDIERLCPTVGRDLIRSLLANLRAGGELTCKGRGPAARWRRSIKTNLE